MVAVHPDRVRLMRQFPAEDIFGGARRVDAIGIGLNLLVQNFSGRRLVRLAESGCRARLLFLNPASSAVKRRERELGIKRGELSRAVEMNILHMRRVRSRLRDPDAFEIQVFDETPRFTAYLVDGDGSDGIAVVQSYLRRSRGMEAPVLVLRNGSYWSSRTKWMTAHFSPPTAMSSSRCGRIRDRCPDLSQGRARPLRR